MKAAARSVTVYFPEFISRDKENKKGRMERTESTSLGLHFNIGRGLKLVGKITCMVGHIITLPNASTPLRLAKIPLAIVV